MSESKLTYTPPPKIAVFHPQLDASGGAEAVCAHLLGTLKDDCSIDLYTMSGTDFAIWNKTFGTNISNDEVQVHKIFNIFDITSRYANLFFRYIPSIVSTEYDKLISTKRMSFFGRKKGLQYVHFPYLADKKVIKKYHPYAFEDRYRNFTKRVRSLPHDLLSPSNSMICRNDTVVNSKWTSRIVQQSFGITPTVVYPPVRQAQSTCLSWDARKEVILHVSALSPHKRTLEVLEIFREVRKESVVDLKMLIVGGLQDEKYSNRVLKKISATEEAEYLGYVEREKLDQLLATCKYGIHGKRLEHFGIAPAEMALSGILPFVPDAGGQVEIVNNISHLTYNGLNDATRKLVTVINNPDLQRKLLGKLSDSEDRFGIDRYRREIKDFVFQTLN